MSLDGLTGMTTEFVIVPDGARMINNTEKIQLLAHRVGQLEEQIEVIKECLKGTQRSAGYLWPDEELCELEVLVNKELFV